MTKRSRFNFQAANQLGTVYAISTNTTLSKSDILELGYQFIEISGAAVLTLPTPDIDLHGITIRAMIISGSVKATQGFGGRGANFDTVTPSEGESVDVWCGKSASGNYYWYALSPIVTA
ncbi:hypothetical protein KAR91_35975 [Candidatus Pacearchaeota archaeon]|nr:hypothetical protein [Candidatus Pacearchaeota archaeon]